MKQGEGMFTLDLVTGQSDSCIKSFLSDVVLVLDMRHPYVRSPTPLPHTLNKYTQTHTHF